MTLTCTAKLSPKDCWNFLWLNLQSAVQVSLIILVLILVITITIIIVIIIMYMEALSDVRPSNNNNCMLSKVQFAQLKAWLVGFHEHVLLLFKLKKPSKIL